MAIKRSREEIELERTIAMANYLILLSKTSNSTTVEPTSSSRVYECKTCNRQFASFQALGGHRASHKKPKTHYTNDDNNPSEENVSKRSKTHGCSICGLEFPIGQALGGHMRRHRAALIGSQLPCTSRPTLSLELELSSHNVSDELTGVIKSRSYSDDHKSVMCLDLNLTPLENGLLEVRKFAPSVC